tara:strand:+ start:698 stop:946 length:249 start_codon:yes stop_codon:yes gene_type:complete
MTTQELENNATKLGYKLVETKTFGNGDLLLCYTLGNGTMQWFRVFSGDYSMWFESYSQKTGRTRKTRSEAAWKLCLGDLYTK